MSKRALIAKVNRYIKLAQSVCATTEPDVYRMYINQAKYALYQYRQLIIN